MSISASVFMVIGFSVQDFKFFDTEPIDKKKCDRGHETNNLKAAYCERCGKKLSRMYNNTATVGFKRLIDEYWKELGYKGVYPDDKVLDGLRNVYYTGDIGLWSERRSSGGISSVDEEVFGISVGKTGDLLSGARGFSISENEISDAKKKIEKYRKIMKIDDPIKIYLLVSVG